MTYFFRNGRVFSPSTTADMITQLPPSTFIIKKDAQGNHFLEEIEDMAFSGKIYGECEAYADRILNTFTSRPTTTGALLSGSKGSGKTMLAKVISAKAKALGFPTIIITEAHAGDALNSFLKAIEQPHVLFIDEFEKIYHDGNTQAKMLSTLDGVIGGKRLNIVTVNEVYRLSDYMINRPGRFFYHIRYRGLDESFIDEYCRENLELDEERVDAEIKIIINLSKTFRDFNFDVLKAIVEEVNRYGESSRDAIRIMNVQPGAEAGTWIFANKNDCVYPEGKVTDIVAHVSGGRSVLTDDFTAEVFYEDEDGDVRSSYVAITVGDMKSFRDGVAHFESVDGLKFDMVKKQATYYDLYSAL